MVTIGYVHRRWERLQPRLLGRALRHPLVHRAAATPGCLWPLPRPSQLKSLPQANEYLGDEAKAKRRKCLWRLMCVTPSPPPRP